MKTNITILVAAVASISAFSTNTSAAENFVYLKCAGITKRTLEGRDLEEQKGTDFFRIGDGRIWFLLDDVPGQKTWSDLCARPDDVQLDTRPLYGCRITEDEFVSTKEFTDVKSRKIEVKILINRHSGQFIWTNQQTSFYMNASLRTLGECAKIADDPMDPRRF